MERHPPPARDLRLAAVAILAAAQAAMFGAVFSDAQASLRLTVASLAAVGLGALLVRRKLALAALLSAAAFVLILIPLAFSATATWGFVPTGQTWHALGAALRVVSDEARTEIAPTPASQPLLMAAGAAVWAAAFAAHALVIRARAAFLALVPGLALAVFAELALDAPRVGRATFLFLACLGVLFADAHQRARTGYRPVSTLRKRLQLTGTIGARRTAAVVSLAALGLVALVPAGAVASAPHSHPSEPTQVLRKR